MLADIFGVCLSLDLSCHGCIYLFMMYLLIFRNGVSFCNPDCPRTHSVDQAGLRLRGPSACLSLLTEDIKGVHHHAGHRCIGIVVAMSEDGHPLREK